MRTLFTTLTAVAILCGMAQTVRAEDADQGKSPGDAKKADIKAERIAFAKLQIKFHRTMADLIEAQIAPEPDKAKIEVLGKELQQVRKELHEKRPPRRGGPGMRPGPGRPWGEPGMGPGRGDDRPGPGMGPGPRGDRGRGRDMGPGREDGPRRGFGPGRGGPEGRPEVPPGPPPWEPGPDQGED
ncbi:MAG: hypothetical protein KKA28_01655 [Planctomycetes bacterium]|nr:hypothetical protein [Planctomycetota bacterium]MCG2682733.1 hypothetical protein [Planctomycetales bacterium]